tara:strand:- start:421 stop:582 length:162 start_codon:yes stop_codon:yes gene_type:complete
MGGFTKADEERFQAENDLSALRQVAKIQKSPKRRKAVRKLVAEEKKALDSIKA